MANQTSREQPALPVRARPLTPVRAYRLERVLDLSSPVHVGDGVQLLTRRAA